MILSFSSRMYERLECVYRKEPEFGMRLLLEVETIKNFVEYYCDNEGDILEVYNLINVFIRMVR